MNLLLVFLNILEFFLNFKGLDPLLRLKIWDHLREITLTGKLYFINHLKKNFKGVTIIITTHYIEEARQANTVGLMRNGK